MKKRKNGWAHVLALSLVIGLTGSVCFAQGEALSWDTPEAEQPGADEPVFLEEEFVDPFSFAPSEAAEPAGEEVDEYSLNDWEESYEEVFPEDWVGSSLEEIEGSGLEAEEIGLFTSQALPAEEEEDFGDDLVGVSISSLVKNGVTIYSLGSDWLWDETYDVPSGYDKSYNQIGRAHV